MASDSRASVVSDRPELSDLSSTTEAVEAARKERGKAAPDATFTFTPRPRPLPAETFDVEPEDEVRDIEPEHAEPETEASEFPDERDGDDTDQNGNQPNEGNGPEPV